jgi:hypothetical protein
MSDDADIKLGDHVLGQKKIGCTAMMSGTDGSHHLVIS